MGKPVDPSLIAAALANKDAARIEISRIECEKSLADFTKEAWHVIEPGTPLTWSWHLDVLCAYLEAFFDGRIKRLILNVPPGSLKSVLTSVMGPSWAWARDPSARIINITNEIGLATRDSLRMKHVVLSDWYKARWGEKVKLSGDQSEKLHFENTARGFRQGLGITANLTGKRGSCLLLDDPCDAKKAFSDIVVAGVNETYDQAVSSRLNHPESDGICLIMQRLRTNDLTGHLLGKKQTHWTHVKIPMEYAGTPGYDPVRDLGPQYAHLADPRTQPGELMFPQRFSRRVVDALKEDLGEYGANGQLQQEPTPLSGGIIRAAHWRVWPDDKTLPRIHHSFLSWDTAFTERDLKDSAYSVATRWGVWCDETDIPRDYDTRSGLPAGRYKLLLLGAWWDRVDMDRLVDQAQKLEKEKLTGDRDAHLIERKASGQSLIQMLRRRTRTRVLGYDPAKDGGGDKIARAYLVQPLFAAGMVWIPNRPWARSLVDIVSSFPTGDALSKDVTDTVTQAVRYIERGWWIHHPDDDLQDSPAGLLSDEQLEDLDAMTAAETRERRVYG